MANEKDLIRKFSEHYQKQEIDQLVNLFSEDATYHDTFYGAFTGHAKIKEMFQMFFRDGKNYVWDMRKVVAEPGAAMVVVRGESRNSPARGAALSPYTWNVIPMWSRARSAAC